MVITSLFAPFLESLRKRLKDPRILKEELTNHGLKKLLLPSGPRRALISKSIKLEGMWAVLCISDLNPAAAFQYLRWHPIQDRNNRYNKKKGWLRDRELKQVIFEVYSRFWTWHLFSHELNPVHFLTWIPCTPTW